MGAFFLILMMETSFGVHPANVRFGSKADIPRRVQLGPLLGAKGTLDVRFPGPMRIFAGNVRFRGQSGRNR